jgi:hypothetical protein
MVNPCGDGLARWVRILRRHGRHSIVNPHLQKTSRQNCGLQQIACTHTSGPWKVFVLRRHPGEVEGLTKHGEKVAKELSELQTSIEKGPNIASALERTQAVLKDLRGVTERVQADLDLIKTKPKLAADILFFENWPRPKEDPQVQVKIGEYAESAMKHIDHLDNLWQKAMLENADPTYVEMIYNPRQDHPAGVRPVKPLEKTLADWQTVIETKNQDNMRDPTQALKNPLTRCRNALDGIEVAGKRENLEVALSAISLVVSYKLKTL